MKMKNTLIIVVIALILAGTAAYIHYAKNREYPGNTNTSLPVESNTTPSTSENRTSKPETTTAPKPVNNTSSTTPTSILKSFNSYEELVEFLKKSSGRESYYVEFALPRFTGGPLVTYSVATTVPTAVPTTQTVAAPETTEKEVGGVPYSKTNVQVSGVDEADVVKTDGEYIYLAKDNKVYIIKAYPPDQFKLVARIDLPTIISKPNSTANETIKKDVVVRGLYTYNNRLVVIAQEYVYRPVITPIILPEPGSQGNNSVETTITAITTTTTITTIPAGQPENVPPTSMPVIIPPPMDTGKTTILVYDIEDKSSPKLSYNISVSGDYMTSRMIDKHLYLLSTMPSKLYDFQYNDYKVLVPQINNKNMEPDKIHYLANTTITNPIYTIILALDVETGEHREQAIIQDYTDRIYMSLNNLYILMEKGFDYDVAVRSVLEKIFPKLPEDLKKTVREILSNNTTIDIFVLDKLSYKLSQWFDSLSRKEQVEVIGEVFEVLSSKYFMVRTAIYKFTVKGLELKLVASGEVPGRVLDQFAMDEYKGYFRIATTVEKPVLVNTTYYPYIDIRFNTTNNVYVLDENLEVIGKLEDLAPSERVYSARFMGNTLFLVTYRRIDPLFAINLTDPKKPEVIGYVKIPGYSEYLHPFKNNLLIGIGIESDEYGRPLGLKISVFNVTNLRDIKEVSTIVFEGDYVASPVLYDHRAFVLNYDKNYMLIPIYGVIYGVADSSKYMEPGIYMITINSETGKLAVKGHITLEYPERALYIGDYVYAIGYHQVIVANEELKEIASLNLD